MMGAQQCAEKDKKAPLMGSSGSGGAVQRQLRNSPKATSSVHKSIIPRHVSREENRMENYIDAVAATADQYAPKCASCLRQFKPLVSAFVKVILFLIPIYKKIYVAVYDVLKLLPHNILLMVFGVALCFFGGVYQASIAAIEAFRTMGGNNCLDDLRYVYDQSVVILEASKKDDLVDADGDGTLDVDQMTPTEFAEHKLRLAMIAVDEPNRLETSVGSLWSAWLAVLATLRLQFARTTALALGVAEMIKFPILRYTAPPLTWALGPDLKHWVNTIVDSSVKLVCILVAWYIQAFISAFYSGLRGGKMFAQGAFEVMKEKGILQKFPDFLVPDKQPFNPDTTYVDEIIAYPVAALGFYVQVVYGFSIPFPMNLIFLPLTLVEYALEIAIAWGSVPEVTSR